VRNLAVELARERETNFQPDLGSGRKAPASTFAQGVTKISQRYCERVADLGLQQQAGSAVFSILHQIDGGRACAAAPTTNCHD
jgi:hypothetical protein